jgi:uncharacterized protein YhaN
MRVQGLQVKRYGVLRDWQVADLSAGVVVFYGPNETGKSTLFDLLASLLYGFSPAKADRHPYSLWADGVPLEMAADLVLQDGQALHVHRRLLPSGPQGSLQRGAAVEKIGNRPLAFVQHVGRDLYRALYALTAYDFQHLDDKHQAEIQDRLLGGFTTTRFKPTYVVLEELQQEANKLWRTDQRSTRHRTLSEESRRVRGERQAAREREDGLRRDIAHLAELQDEREKLRRERAELQARVRRADTLQPVARILDQLATWRREVGDERRLERLPTDLRGELRRLRDDRAAREAELAGLVEEADRQEETVAAFGAAQRQVLEHTDTIREWVRSAELHDQEQREIETLDGELRRWRERLDEWAVALLDAPWSEGVAEAVQAVSPAELKARLAQCGRDREEHVRHRAAREHKEHNAPIVPPPVSAWIGLAGLTGALLLITIGWAGAGVIFSAAGAALLVLAFGVLGLGWWQRQTVRQLLQRYRVEVGVLREREEEAAGRAEHSGRRVAELLAAVPVAPALLAQADPDLFEDFNALRTGAAEVEQLASQLDERRLQWQTDRQRLENLAAVLNEPPPDPRNSGAAGAVADRLNAKLEQAVRARQDYERARESLKELERRRQEVEQRLESLRKRYQQLKTEVETILNSRSSIPLEEAVDRVADKQDLLQLLRHHEQELQRRHADLPALKEEIAAWRRETASTGDLSDPVETEAAKDRLEVLETESERLYKEIVELEKEIEAAKSGPSPGELDGRLEMLKEQQSEVARQRDRLILMRAVLQRADRDFRERHQPDVLRRAGVYLERITGGRYTQLLLTDAEDGGEELVVQPGPEKGTGYFFGVDEKKHPALLTNDSPVNSAKDRGQEKVSGLLFRPEPVPVGAPLSRGTLDQIFLAFRLAVIDHLDRDHERLPLFLDEVLVNWDDFRLPHGIALLGEIAARRQVFLFTCRRALAELIGEQLGVPVLSTGDFPSSPSILIRSASGK